MENLQIYKTIGDFETGLQDYINSVQKFNPNPSSISQLIKSDEKIEEFVRSFIEHQKFGNELQRLKQGNVEINTKLIGILQELNDCRDVLLELPDNYEIDDKDDEPEELEEPEVKKQDKKLTSEELLKYAARLSKFTTIPATSDLNIGPNNYIWPAEDALRKGMMATATKYGDELVNIKKEDEPVEETQSIPDTNVLPEVASRRGSFEAYTAPVHHKQAEPVAVALDLFNSDDDSD